MDGIADLQSFAAKADVAQRSSGVPGVKPEQKNALFGSPKLAGSCQHTAAVDPNWETIRSPIFERQGFGS